MSLPAEDHAFSLPERQAVYRAIYKRRDMRHFCGGTVTGDMLQRLLSAACAIQNLWLAARVEGLDLGWVSIFDPLQLAALLRMPAGSKPITILCLGR